MLKFTKVAFATLLAAFLLVAGMGCQYLDSAKGESSVDVSTQKTAPVAEPAGGITSVKVTVVFINSESGEEEGKKTFKLKEFESFLKNNNVQEAYWDSTGHQKINLEELDVSSFDENKTIYVDAKYMPKNDSKPSSGEGEGGSGSSGSSETVTVKLVTSYGGYTFDTGKSQSMTLSQISAYAKQGVKAYWDADLKNEINDFSSIKAGDTIYVDVSQLGSDDSEEL